MVGIFGMELVEQSREIARKLEALPEEECIDTLNAIRAELHAASPFRDEPVDLIRWIPATRVTANDYNPNTVAPPEMRLLETSILADGFTQPIVTHDEGTQHVVIDGFHRNRIGKESKEVRRRTKGYLPVVQIRAEQVEIEKRMASTIRHNRARGKHGVEPMTGIVSYLAKKGWDNGKIGKELGMDADEVLRFKQITGLAELFKDAEFSKSWTVE